jgi:GTPase SAR1 family protein
VPQKKRPAQRRTQADDAVRKNLPPGVKLVRTLRGHTRPIGRIAWSPDGQMLASPSHDGTIRLWDHETGQCLRVLEDHRVHGICVAFDPTSRTLASSGLDTTVKLWEPATGKLLRRLQVGSPAYSVVFDPTGHILACGTANHGIVLCDPARGTLLHRFPGQTDPFLSITFHPAGHILASGGGGWDHTVKLWDLTGRRLLRTLEGHREAVCGVAFDPVGETLATGGFDRTVKLWEPVSGKLLRTLEGHTNFVTLIAFSGDGRIVASKSHDGTLRLWARRTGTSLAVIPVDTDSEPLSAPGFAIHPSLPLLATVDSMSSLTDCLISIYELDLSNLSAAPVEPSAHYVNAKVVLVGDTGVGKTGLSLVLNHQPFEATDSTPGRRVWTFDAREMPVGGYLTQTRETLLWDLAGQPGYRVIHQLHLNEVAVALVVFDARSEIDPLAGVRHWERALRLAQQRQGTAGVPMKKFLVSARNDRGGVSISEERLQALLTEFGFDGYFKTSAKEGWQIAELRAAIEQAIPWDNLPEVSSSQLFADIKSFLLAAKKTGRLLTPVSQLYDDFARQHPTIAAHVANLRDQFETCIGRLENRDLIRRLTFGGYVLLQPELLDAYASAMINTAKEEPDGLGSLDEEVALSGKFVVPREQKVIDPGQEQLLLHATVEELVRYDLALWENANNGRSLVFPSQFNRDYEDAPEPQGKAVAITLR